MKQYKDLDLKAIRKEAKLDFAHFTYKSGQCSCCYSPLDFPARYWEGGETTKEKFVKINEEEHKHTYSYILFKNADNGRGSVKGYSTIEDGTFVGYCNLTDEQMDIVVKMLQEQLGYKYKVIKPQDEYTCIEIVVN